MKNGFEEVLKSITELLSSTAKDISWQNHLNESSENKKEDDSSLFEAAIKVGNADRVKELLDIGCNPLQQSQGVLKYPAFHIACLFQQLEIVKLMLSHNPDIIEVFKYLLPKTSKSIINSSGVDGLNHGKYFIESTKKGDKYAVELVKNGLDLDTKLTTFKFSLLYRAAQYKCPKTLKELLKRGSDCNEQNELGAGPFEIAVQKNYSEIVKILLKYGVEISDYAKEFTETSYMLIKQYIPYAKKADEIYKNYATDYPEHDFAQGIVNKRIINLFKADLKKAANEDNEKIFEFLAWIEKQKSNVEPFKSLYNKLIEMVSNSVKSNIDISSAPKFGYEDLKSSSDSIEIPLERKKSSRSSHSDEYSNSEDFTETPCPVHNGNAEQMYLLGYDYSAPNTEGLPF